MRFSLSQDASRFMSHVIPILPQIIGGKYAYPMLAEGVLGIKGMKSRPNIRCTILSIKNKKRNLCWVQDLAQKLKIGV